jgi:hypothetical protein
MNDAGPPCVLTSAEKGTGLPRKPSLNWLLIFIPLALIPIAGLIVKATEQIALRTNDSVGGLLNATFGNAPELIIGMVALRAGLLDMVRASLIGAILANLLLALGLSFFLGGIRHHVQRFNPVAARSYSTMMRRRDRSAQLYIHETYKPVSTPVKQLRGFERVSLAAGESKTVTFTLTSEDISLLDEHMRRVVVPGDFEIMVGRSAEDLPLQGMLKVQNHRGGSAGSNGR